MQQEPPSISHRDILDDFDKTTEEVEQLAKFSKNPPDQEPSSAQKHILVAASELHRQPQTYVEQHHERTVAQDDESPAAPAKPLSLASKLQAALSPVNFLGKQNEGGHDRSAMDVLNENNHDTEQSKEKMGSTNATHQPPSKVKLQAKQKRQLENKDTRQTKRGRAAEWQPSLGPYAMRVIVQSPEKSKPSVERKPKLVHFDNSGPMNQGTQPSKRAKAQLPLPSHVSARAPELQPSQSNKRNFTSIAAGNSTMTIEARNGKRRKGDEMKMHRAQDKQAVSHPQILAQPSNVEQLLKHNSQSSRVDEYGSPMPFRHSRQATLAAPKVVMLIKSPTDPLRARFDLDDYTAFDDFAAESPQPKLPAMEQNTLPLIAESRAGVMSNTKYRPSSPNAPSSIITDMAAHRVQPSGHFVGLRTNAVVVPQKPQDPFLVRCEDRPDNNFMGRLRRSSQNHAREEQSNRRESDGDMGDAPERNSNDPDKTLVSESLSQGEQESSPTSDSSPSSNTSQSQGQPDAEASDDDSDPGGEWRRALRADHRESFDTLCELAHVCVQIFKFLDVANDKLSIW